MKHIMSLLIILITASAFAERVSIYAAASTTNAVKEIIEAYKSVSAVDIVPTLASSGTLAKQIDNNAPADIFLSANVKWMNWLKDRNKLETASIADLLSNRLALITSADSDIPTQALTKENTAKFLKDTNKIAIADPAHSPAGKYTQKALESLGLWEQFADKTARMQTVRMALMMVEKGAIQIGGVVFSSDAANSRKVKTIGLFDENLHGEIRYPPIAIVAGKKRKFVDDFYNFLSGGEQAKSIFMKHGFKAVR